MDGISAALEPTKVEQEMHEMTERFIKKDLTRRSPPMSPSTIRSPPSSKDKSHAKTLKPVKGQSTTL